MFTSSGVSRAGSAPGIIISKDNWLVLLGTLTDVYQASDAVNIGNMATLTLYIDIVLGTATYVDVKVQYSSDNISWYDEEVPSALPTGEITSVTAYRRYTTDSAVRIGVKAQDRYVRVAAKADVVATTADVTISMKAGGATDTVDISGGATTIVGTADVNLLEVAGNPVDVGAGVVGAGTQRTTLGSDDPAVASLASLVGVTGAGADAKVDTDAVGTLSAKLRGVVSRLVELAGVSGVTTGAAVTTDADGTLQQYLRGLVVGFAAKIPVLGQALMAASMPVTVASDQSVLPVGVGARGALLSSAAVDCAALGDNTLIAGVALQMVNVYRIVLVFGANVEATLYDGAAGTALTGPIPMAAGGSFTLDFDGEPWFTCSAATEFVLNLSAAVQVSGRVYYTQA
jgi:hypothetical protein